jgi:hypothetical protein
MPTDLRSLHRINPPAGVADWIGRDTRPPLAVRAGWQPSTNVVDYRQGQPTADRIASLAEYTLGALVRNIVSRLPGDAPLPLPQPPVAPVPRLESDYRYRPVPFAPRPRPLRVSRSGFGSFTFQQGDFND